MVLLRLFLFVSVSGASTYSLAVSEHFNLILPEPSTLGLVFGGLGLIALLVYRSIKS